MRLLRIFVFMSVLFSLGCDNSQPNPDTSASSEQKPTGPGALCAGIL